MTEIKNIAVIGSGVMGSGIAALIANAGYDVLLLDIVPKDAGDDKINDATARNALAQKAIDSQAKAKIPGFTHKRNAKRVTAGNLEDDISRLAEMDWIIEVVVERLEIKHSVYQKIDAHRKVGSIVSSNTSTLPLHALVQGQSDAFKADFCITHFFNPPRFMRLLELVGGKTTKPEILKTLTHFCDAKLGKKVVVAKDTPGFLANRIGVFWLMAGLLDAMEMGIDIEDADAVMGKPVGIPKTGVFGLFDLIGIDLMPLIAKAMEAMLPESDAFRQMYREPALVTQMIADGYTGRKGKGGFYRLAKDDSGKRVKESINLQTGDYAPAKKSKLQSVAAGRLGLAAVLGHDDIGGKYAASLMLKTLHYAASLVPEISDDILSIDRAMRTGYNWKYGPFELIDRLAWDGMEGTAIFAAKCAELGLPVPAIIAKAAGKPLYKEEGGKRHYMRLEGDYSPIERSAGSQMLIDIKRGAKPVKKNPSATLWDLGDGVLGLELTSKANTFDPENLKMIAQAPAIVKEGFTGLVIGSDAEHFSFGANIGYFMMACNTASWWAISDMVTQGQEAYMGLKYAPFPVVSALSGMALGGGCELQLHVDAVAAHIESYPGLVEVGIGVIPGWGGCKEMVLRHIAQAERVKKQVMSGQKPEALMPQGPMPPIAKAFEYISLAKVAGSAQEAQEMLIVNQQSRIVMNRERVLPDAKALCLELAEGYETPERPTFRLPGGAGKAALDMVVEGFVSNGKATAHDEVVSKALATVLTGGNCDITDELDEQHLLDLERDLFMELVRSKATQDRISHMLNTNKPLRN